MPRDIKEKNFSTQAGRIYSLANKQFKEGEYRKAYIEYKKVLSIYYQIFRSYPTSDTYITIGGIYHKLALTCIKSQSNKNINIFDNILYIFQDGLRQDIEICQKFPKVSTISIKLHYNLGNIHAANQNYDEAILEYKKALDLEGKTKKYNSSIIYRHLAGAYYESKQYLEAIENLKIYLEVKNRSEKLKKEIIFDAICISYIKIKKYKEGLEYIEKSLNSQNPDLILSLLIAEQILSNNFKKAEEYCRKVNGKYDLKSKSLFQFLCDKAIFCYHHNLIQEAVNIVKSVIEIDIDLEPNYYHNLACFYLADGKVQEANVAFKKAIKVTEKSNMCTSEIYVEYAQFLLINKPKYHLEINDRDITNYLYKAIHYNVEHNLLFGKLEKEHVCGALKELIDQNNKPISVNPKILAYYLLLTNCKYMEFGDFDKITFGFKNFIKMNQEIVQDILYQKVGNELLSEQTYTLYPLEYPILSAFFINNTASNIDNDNEIFDCNDIINDLEILIS